MSGLTGPRTAVRGNKIAAGGMAIAVVATLLTPHVLSGAVAQWLIAGGQAVGMAIAVVPTLLTPHVLSGAFTAWLIAVGLLIGTAVGVPAALRVHISAI